MKTALFYDIETSGLPDWRCPSEAPHQPHMVQLAACLVDVDSRAIVASVDLIIRPDGWDIPADVARIHGISTERAMALGVGERAALNILLDLWRCAAYRVAHNEPFDSRIVRIALKRYFGETQDPGATLSMADHWTAGAAECTQRLATPICALPQSDRMKAAGVQFKHKSPNLREAFKHFAGFDLEHAHSASVDVRACIAVYFGIKDHNAALRSAAHEHQATEAGQLL